QEFLQMESNASPFIIWAFHPSVINATLKITWSEKVEYVTNNADSIPSAGGVYEILGRKKTDGGYTRRYVGISDNLKEAYAKHFSTEESNEKLRQFLKEKKSFFRYIKSYFLVTFLSLSFVPAFATQNNISDSNLQVELTYPDMVKQGSEFVLSSIVKAMVDQVSNITLTISSPEIEFSQNSFHID